MFERTDEDAIRHLFTVAASLDSMVVGEAQILSQVKRAYEMATVQDNTGPLTHSAFQAAIRVAKRVSSETAIQHKRVSIPSVAVADFAESIYERFDDKQVLVIGAGEMGEETLRYLVDEGARQITIVNRNPARAEQLAERMSEVVINKLGDLDDKSRGEITRAFDRLVSKMLHPPLESLRDEAKGGAPHMLLDALKRLFQLKD